MSNASCRLSTVAEETIRAYFETRLALLEPVFPLACHRLCEGPDFSLEFNYKPPQHTPAEGRILASNSSVLNYCSFIFPISVPLLCFLSQDLASCFLSSMQTSLMRSQLDSAGPVVFMLSC